MNVDQIPARNNIGEIVMITIWSFLEIKGVVKLFRKRA